MLQSASSNANCIHMRKHMAHRCRFITQRMVETEKEHRHRMHIFSSFLFAKLVQKGISQEERFTDALKWSQTQVIIVVSVKLLLELLGIKHWIFNGFAANTRGRNSEHAAHIFWTLRLSADVLVGGGHFLQGLRFYPYLRETPLDFGGDSVCFACTCMHMCMSVRSRVCTCNCMHVRARALCVCKSCIFLFGWHVLRVLLHFFVWHIYSFVFAQREKLRVQPRGTIVWNEVTKQVICFAGADVTKLAGTDRQVLYLSM